jgi:hypothetical protein
VAQSCELFAVSATVSLGQAGVKNQVAYFKHWSAAASRPIASPIASMAQDEWNDSVLGSNNICLWAWFRSRATIITRLSTVCKVLPGIGGVTCCMHENHRGVLTCLDACSRGDLDEAEMGIRCDGTQSSRSICIWYEQLPTPSFPTDTLTSTAMILRLAAAWMTSSS